MPPKISLIIPACNEENYLRKTLHSIKSQTCQDFEVIVVANGCTDGTEEIVRKRENEKVRLLSLPKPNVSVARNAGALNAQGEILVFLDADTQLEEDSLQKIRDEFTPEYALATTKSKPDEDKLKYRAFHRLKDIYYSTIYEGCSGILICRRDDFHKAGGYNPELAVKEHRKLILQLKKLGEYKQVDTFATTSMRRYEQWGLGRVAYFWLRQFWKDKTGKLKESEYEKVR